MHQLMLSRTHTHRFTVFFSVALETEAAVCACVRSDWLTADSDCLKISVLYLKT